MLTVSDETLAGFLAEDVPFGDLTTRSLGINAVQGVMTFSARGAMTLACVEEAARLIVLAGATVTLSAQSADQLDPGQPILTASGTAEALMAGWKVAQTLVEWASGIASSANRIVMAARAARSDIVVSCTRKAIPGTRALSAKAVLAGGAQLHRTGLSETLLVFPEHRAIAQQPLAAQIGCLKRNCPERKIVVEVKSADAALAAVDAGADIVQLEKFNPAQIAALMAAETPDLAAKLIAAGGINADNAAAYAGTGVAVLVTSAPYTARPCDVQVTIGPA
ncbi:ModD protein [Martelella sp. HB161492]|uniref:ModD protein n=1 Tax=Martelella sp. HB161492 TaxID=2720726 RepID=UPI00159108DE|nr:ModD protein [Martelella sp. HB161492]